MPNPFRDPKDSITIHISSLSIFKVLGVFLILVFAYLVWDIIVLLFVSLLFAASLTPAIDWMEGKKIPRAVGILLIYAAVLLLLSLVAVLIIPPITEQIQQLASTLPSYYERLIQSFGNFKLQSDTGQVLQQNLSSVGQTLSSYTGSVFSLVSGLFGGVVTFVTVLVLTFYFIVKKDGLKNFVRSLSPIKSQKYAVSVFLRIQDKLGLWLRGQLLLSGIIFLWPCLVWLSSVFFIFSSAGAGTFDYVPAFLASRASAGQITTILGKALIIAISSKAWCDAPSSPTVMPP